MVSERPHQEKNKTGCWRQVWNGLQYGKVENCDYARRGQCPSTVFISDIEPLARLSTKDGQYNQKLI